MIKVEYLVAINIKTGLCQSVDSFKSLLMSNSRITFAGNKIKFDGCEFNFKVDEGEIEQNELKYYHFSIESAKTKIENLNDLCRELRKILIKVCENNTIQILWDGIGFELCKQAYPKIYEIENVLRKLITKFMLSKVGLSWHKQALPKEVKESIRSDGDKESSNCLYEADFIQLSNFLFKAYAKKDINKWLSEISKKSESEFKKSEFDDYIPKSNWERYFSSLVNCDSVFIERRWQRLYELRCKVAHNKTFGFQETKELAELIGELLPKFQEAIQKLEQITVPEEEKEQVAESVAKFRNDTYFKFLDEVNKLNKCMIDLQKIKLPTYEIKVPNLVNMAKIFEQSNTISKQYLDAFKDIQNTRNLLVHNYNFEIPENVLIRKMNAIEDLKEEIKGKIENKKEDDNIEQNKTGESDTEPEGEPDC